MPSASVTVFLVVVGMFASWLAIRLRMPKNRSASSYQTRLMANYFLLMGTTCTFQFLPLLLIESRPADFPLAMAIGYVIAHIFVYQAFIQITKLNISFFPRLANKQKAIVLFMNVLAAVLVVFNAYTMIWGTRPEYLADSGVTLFHTHPLLSLGILVMSSLSIFPAAILMIRNGIINRASRLRSFLLGGGLGLVIASAPMHDFAKNASDAALANVVTLIGLGLLTSGVMYRITERMAVPSKVAARARN